MPAGAARSPGWSRPRSWRWRHSARGRNGSAPRSAPASPWPPTRSGRTCTSRCFRGPESAALFEPLPGGDRLLFDLKAYVLRRLARAGIAQRHALAEDTFADEARFFSARRTAPRGRRALRPDAVRDHARRLRAFRGCRTAPADQPHVREHRPEESSHGQPSAQPPSSGDPARDRAPRGGSRASRDAMAGLAADLLAALDDAQRRAAQWPFEDAERFNWHYVPRPRAGARSRRWAPRPRPRCTISCAMR